jgi:hypothetical protein
VSTPTTGIEGEEGIPLGRTRLQAAFGAIRSMSAGLASPRVNFAMRTLPADGGSPGYFNVLEERGDGEQEDV